jgi:hypothetical protein
MSEKDAWLTPKQAAELVGLSTRVIQKRCEKGDIPHQKEDGKYYIQKADFFRMYPEAHRREQHGNASQRDIDHARMSVENELLKQMLEQSKKEVDFLKGQANVSTEEKKQMLEAINHHARLLEHKETSKVDNASSHKRRWKDIFKRKKS